MYHNSIEDICLVAQTILYLKWRNWYRMCLCQFAFVQKVFWILQNLILMKIKWQLQVRGSLRAPSLVFSVTYKNNVDKLKQWGKETHCSFELILIRWDHDLCFGESLLSSTKLEYYQSFSCQLLSAHIFGILQRGWNFFLLMIWCANSSVILVSLPLWNTVVISS